MTKSADPPTILLVEDNPGDVRMTREAFSDIDVPVTIHATSDSVDALALLRGDRPDVDGPRPQLVLLDLNLDGIDGETVLGEIKSDESLRRIPVIVLTTSDDVVDIERMYDNHANAYVTKPDTAAEFIAMIDHLQSFWLSTAKLPDATRHR